jgi:hypothetical protein
MEFSVLLMRYGVLTVAIGLLIRLVLVLTSSLRSVPGPFLARFTRFWYFWRVALGKFQYDEIALHKKYGPIVRVAPNMYSIDHPEVVKKVYGIGSKFAKSKWYYGWQHPDPGKKRLEARLTSLRLIMQIELPFSQTAI